LAQCDFSTELAALNWAKQLEGAANLEVTAKQIGSVEAVATVAATMAKINFFKEQGNSFAIIAATSIVLVDVTLILLAFCVSLLI
jgi:hypothetical protein